MKGVRRLEDQTGLQEWVGRYRITLEHIHGALDFHIVSIFRNDASVTFWWSREPTATELKQLLDFVHDNYNDIESMMVKRRCTYIFLDAPTEKHFGLKSRFKWG